MHTPSHSIGFEDDPHVLLAHEKDSMVLLRTSALYAQSDVADSMFHGARQH